MTEMLPGINGGPVRVGGHDGVVLHAEGLCQQQRRHHVHKGLTYIERMNKARRKDMIWKYSCFRLYGAV